jgi:hypothetical protein
MKTQVGIVAKSGVAYANASARSQLGPYPVDEVRRFGGCAISGDDLRSESCRLDRLPQQDQNALTCSHLHGLDGIDGDVTLNHAALQTFPAMFQFYHRI